MKITQENLSKIQQALDNANGKSIEHTLHKSADVLELARLAENRLVALLGVKKMSAGAKAHYRSGAALPNAYKFQRKVTTVSMIRKTGGWYITSVNVHMERNTAGRLTVQLTKEQDEQAVKNLRSVYGIQSV